MACSGTALHLPGETKKKYKYAQSGWPVSRPTFESGPHEYEAGVLTTSPRVIWVSKHTKYFAVHFPPQGNVYMWHHATAIKRLYSLIPFETINGFSLNL
jgi:hypothetical protein